MKKVLVTVFLPLFALSSSAAFASTTVDVSNNGSGSSSHVEVHNSVNSSSTSTNTSNTQTDVRIESNGEVKEYHSTNGGNVHVESSDGSAQVDINNNTQGVSSGSENSDNTTTTHISVTPPESNISAQPSVAPHEVKHSTSSQKNFFIQLIMYIPEKVLKFLKFW